MAAYGLDAWKPMSRMVTLQVQRSSEPSAGGDGLAFAHRIPMGLVYPRWELTGIPRWEVGKIIIFKMDFEKGIWTRFVWRGALQLRDLT